jgi:hypothetical protein
MEEDFFWIKPEHFGFLWYLQNSLVNCFEIMIFEYSEHALFHSFADPEKTKQFKAQIENDLIELFYSRMKETQTRQEVGMLFLKHESEIRNFIQNAFNQFLETVLP